MQNIEKPLWKSKDKLLEQWYQTIVCHLWYSLKTSIGQCNCTKRDTPATVAGDSETAREKIESLFLHLQVSVPSLQVPRIQEDVTRLLSRVFHRDIKYQLYVINHNSVSHFQCRSKGALFIKNFPPRHGNNDQSLVGF